MAIFVKGDNKVRKLKIIQFTKEKSLQKLFEDNLDEIFGVKFLKSEFSTTNGGRIDTLGIDNNLSPVIIEYKKTEKDNIINQGLFYLDWLLKNKYEFSQLLKEKLGQMSASIDVNWADTRLILVAQSYNKFDKYAVNRLSDNVELWKYIIYEEGILNVERLNLPHGDDESLQIERKERLQKEYDLNHHIGDKSENIKGLVNTLREEIQKLDEQIIEKFRAKYISYSVDKNFAEVITQSGGLWVHIDALKSELSDPKNKIEDVSDKGHWATGDSKIRIENMDDLWYAMNIIKKSYELSL